MNFIGNISFTSVKSDNILQRIKDNENLQRPELMLDKETTGITLRYTCIKSNSPVKMIINEKDILDIESNKTLPIDISSIVCETAGAKLDILYIYGNRMETMPSETPSIDHLEQQIRDLIEEFNGSIEGSFDGLEERLNQKINGVTENFDAESAAVLDKAKKDVAAALSKIQSDSDAIVAQAQKDAQEIQAVKTQSNEALESIDEVGSEIIGIKNEVVELANTVSAAEVEVKTIMETLEQENAKVSAALVNDVNEVINNLSDETQVTPQDIDDIMSLVGGV